MCCPVEVGLGSEKSKPEKHSRHTEMAIVLGVITLPIIGLAATSLAAWHTSDTVTEQQTPFRARREHQGLRQRSNHVTAAVSSRHSRPTSTASRISP